MSKRMVGVIVENDHDVPIMQSVESLGVDIDRNGITVSCRGDNLQGMGNCSVGDVLFINFCGGEIQKAMRVDKITKDYKHDYMHIKLSTCHSPNPDALKMLTL